MTAKRPSISAFFPAYNDGGTIGSLVVTTLNTLAELTDDYEVIVVENGSTDYTVEVLEELEKQYSHFRALTHRQALGYGGALRVGFAACTKDLIFYTDGDAQYDPREIKQLLAALRDDVDIVNGWKIERQDPLHRILQQLGGRLRPRRALVDLHFPRHRTHRDTRAVDHTRGGGLGDHQRPGGIGPGRIGIDANLRRINGDRIGLLAVQDRAAGQQHQRQGHRQSQRLHLGSNSLGASRPNR